MLEVLGWESVDLWIVCSHRPSIPLLSLFSHIFTGCPFRHFDRMALRAKLAYYRVPQQQITDVCMK